MSDWISAASTVLATAWIWLGSDLLPLLLPLIPVLALLWAIQSYRRGGSVVRVEFEVGKLDAAGALIKAKPAAWSDAKDPAEALNVKVDPMNIDVGVVTVRNLGRTSATVTDVGLFVGYQKWKPVHYGGVLISPGETGTRHRIEAHDSRRFVFELWGPIELARQDLDKVNIPVQARVETGTGKQRRSRRWGRWKVGNATHLGAAPELGAQILRDYAPSGLPLSELAGEIALVIRLVEDGADHADVMDRLGDPRGNPQQAFRLMQITTRVIDSQPDSSQP